MKNIIFDLGKVLVDYDFDVFYKELDYEPKLETLMESTIPVLEFEAGKLSRQEFYQKLKDIYKFEHNIEEFEKIWCSVFTELTELVDFAKELKKDYNIYVLSNTDEIHFNSIWEQFPALHFFEDNLMLSYELDSVKPQKEIYERALNMFNLKPEECLFIDDKQENISGAKRMGITGILFTNATETKRKIKELL
ncbi:MAG: HAD family phosphatase [Candidatus Cloacimonetes bacterium]|jgi:HAD superfamily hydrolase (TIGR01509 family)|nr:HAD family phosphatase [Candidatus Cloacimonadota bacterium]MBT4332787.1 HAD family phosphatase [Candidatus Cloacimonadota bacterium]MBT4574907.1 HAD family phosphatase [Candidatus Cloacimonadota bacterium]